MPLIINDFFDLLSLQLVTDALIKVCKAESDAHRSSEEVLNILTVTQSRMIRVNFNFK